MNNLASHLERSPLIHSTWLCIRGRSINLVVRLIHETHPFGACAKNLFRRFFSQLAPKTQILRAICGLTILIPLQVFLFTPATVLANELPQKFEANYTLEIFGITLAKATHKLEQTEKGLSMAVYSYPVGLLAFLYDGHVDIRSDVAIDNGQLLLVNHDYNHSEDAEDTTVRYKIDWLNDQKKGPTGNVTGIYKGETININSDAPIWDPLSIQALIIINADKESESNKHGLLMKGELRHYLIENMGKETISFNGTDMTALKTLVKEADRDRVIYVWMLPEYHNIPIKYEHWKNGNLTSTVRLQSVTFENDGRTNTLTVIDSTEDDIFDDEDW